MAGLAVQLLAANTLDPAANARFLIFWSLLFGVFGVLAGVQNETTRAVRSAETRAAALSTPTGHPRVLPVGLGIGAVIALLLAVTSPWWSAAVLTRDHGADLASPASSAPGASLGTVAAVTAVCLGTLAFAGHVTAAGALAGRGRWGDYSLLVGSESTVRFLLTVAVAVAGATLVGYEVAAAASAATWLLLSLLRPHLRATWQARADRPAGAYLRALAQAMGAAAATAGLVTGYAVMIDVTTPAEVVEASAPFLLALSLTRATLLMPVNAFQGMAIAHVVANPHRARPILVRVGALLGALGVVGALIAWAIGPWILDLLRPGYRVEGIVLAGLLLGGASLALLVLVSSVCLAMDHHSSYVVGWVAAFLAAFALLWLPAPLETRAIASLTLGPLVGTAIHATTLLRATRRP